MQAKTRNILQQRADEDARARREAIKQRRAYREAQERTRPLQHRPFANLPELIFGGDK